MLPDRGQDLECQIECAPPIFKRHHWRGPLSHRMNEGFQFRMQWLLRSHRRLADPDLRICGR